MYTETQYGIAVKVKKMNHWLKKKSLNLLAYLPFEKTTLSKGYLSLGVHQCQMLAEEWREEDTLLFLWLELC